MPPKKKTAAAANPADGEGAPASPTPAEFAPSGNPTEVFTHLQEAVAANPVAINEHVPELLELVHTAENTETPILLRVRFLEFVSRIVAHLRDDGALQKIVTSLVKVIGGDDNTPQLLTAALNCFVGLGPVSMMDKKWEYLSREGSDILMQVMLDKEAFPEPARHAAAKALDSLTTTAFKSVITKLIHWISDDREEEEEQQLLVERQLAITRLTRMVTGGSHRAQWTDELQTEVLALIQRVLGTVDAREFTQLVRIMSHLPICQEKHGVPLLELFVSKYDLKSERHLESVTIIGRYVKEGAEFDLLPFLDKAKLLAKPITNDAHGVWLSRVVLLATRIATSDNAEKLFEYVFGQLSALVGADEELPANLSVVEAFLMAATNIARKKPTEVLHKLHEDTFNAKMVSLVKAIEKVEPEATFVVKKHMMNHEVQPFDGEMLAAIHNIKILGGAISSKHLPMADVKPSWAGQQKLPHMKRYRDPSKGLPAPHAGKSGRRGGSPPAKKRFRTDSRRGGPRRGNRRH